jgi:hypothetical protein
MEENIDYTKKEIPVTLEEFKIMLKVIEDFEKERTSLEEVLKIISPSSTGVVEFGSNIITEYIKLLEKLLGLNNEDVSWFIYDNNSGKSKLKYFIENKEYIIKNEEDFYNILPLLKTLV